MLKRILTKIEPPKWLLLLLTVVLILRIPSFFEPYSYGDEMIYLTLGQGIHQGVPLYSGLHDNKPPVLYLIAAAAGSLFWFKVFLAIAGFVAIIFFWKIVKILFKKNEKLQKIATVIFALLATLPVFEGNTANAENFILAFSLCAIYFLLSKKLSFKNLFFSGVLFAISALTKIPAIFDLPVVIVFWLIIKELKKESLKETLKNTFYILVGFSIPILISFLWFFAMNSLTEYIKAVFSQNIGYLSSWRPGDIQKSFLVRNLPLFTRAFIVLAGTVILYISRKRLSKPFILASIWILFALFAATLSERPYPHYLLQTVAPMSILLGILFSQKSLEQSLVIFPLAIFFLVPVYYRFWYYDTFSYYNRFIQFALGKTSKTAYFSKFNLQTPRNYEIAAFLANSLLPSEKVFVWGPDSPTIYALSRRLPPIKFVADYHINDFSNKDEVASLLVKSRPKFIVLTPEAGPFGQIIPFLRTSYLLINRIEQAEVWSLINFKK